MEQDNCNSCGITKKDVTTENNQQTGSKENIWNAYTPENIRNSYSTENIKKINRTGSNVSFKDTINSFPDSRKNEPFSKRSLKQQETWIEKYTSCRWIVIYMSFVFLINQTIALQSMSIALVCMVQNVTTKIENYDNGTEPVTDVIEDYYVDWDIDLQGLVLSSFFYLFPFTPLLGGYLSGRFGAKYMVLVSTGILILANVLIPVCAHISGYIVVVLRSIGGLCAGAIVVSLTEVSSRWAPLTEKAQMVSLIFSAQTLGSIITMTVSGFACGIPIQGGWPFIFYIFGGIALLCFIPWMACVYDYPLQHPRITLKEINYIDRGRRTSTSSQMPDPPWIKILTSGPFWGILAAHTTQTYVYITLGTLLPLYMNSVLQFSVAEFYNKFNDFFYLKESKTSTEIHQNLVFALGALKPIFHPNMYKHSPKYFGWLTKTGKFIMSTENGVLSSLPFVGRFIGAVISGHVSDILLARRCLSITTVRKLFQVFGSIVSAPCLIVVSFLDKDSRELAVAIIVVYWTIQSTTNTAYRANTLDIAPRFAGIIGGLATTAAGLTQLLAPVVTSALTKTGTREEWQVVFFICVGVSVGGGIMYAIFASGEEQDWAKDRDITIEIDNKTWSSDIKQVPHENEEFKNDKPDVAKISDFNIQDESESSLCDKNGVDNMGFKDYASTETNVTAFNEDLNGNFQSRESTDNAIKTIQDHSLVENFVEITKL